MQAGIMRPLHSPTQDVTALAGTFRIVVPVVFTRQSNPVHQL